MLQVLIADKDEEFCQMLMEQIQGLYHVVTCREGNQALELLDACRPDILVLDLMLPGLDGISLLRSAAAAGICPAVLATSRFMSDYILESLRHLDVGYVMLKPCDIRATVHHINELCAHLENPRLVSTDSRTVVSNMLLALGVPPKLHGFGYLREAVLLMSANPGQSITKELYPAVGKRCGVSAVQVERSMRSAIHAAWCRGDRRYWRIYFSLSDQHVLQKPSNGAFISRLAQAQQTQRKDDQAQQPLLCAQG